MTMQLRYATACLFLCATAATASADNSLDCLTEKERASAALDLHLRDEAITLLRRRSEKFELLKTAAEIKVWQAARRRFMTKQLGGFPERGPLNARTVGVIKADGYQIEKVIYDSVPNHRITANLYLPDTDEPVGGVVVSSGHSRTAKTADYNQRFGIMMAKQGMAALCYDPIGQGERSQVLDNGKPVHGSTTTEHFLVGVGSTLVGRNTARYRVWDAMRSIDYLSGRSEVDAKRIGFTGCSGGGTLTSYVMALDPRVACAAPACYLTTLEHLLTDLGPQDAEQNIYGQIGFGLDHADYVIMRAPRPTLISSTTSDYFSIEGAWDTFRQSKRVYAKLGFPERVDLVEVPGKHGVHPQNLATIAQWMKRWLMKSDEPVEPVVLATRPAEELLCTETGQVLTSLPGELSVFQLNAEYEMNVLRAARKSLSPSQRRERIVAMLGVGDPEKLSRTKWRDIGRVSRDDYHIDKLVMRPNTGVPLPALTYHPPVPVDDAYLYLHDQGKLGDGQEGGPIEELVRDGNVVVTVDLSGQGETAAGGRNNALLGEWKSYYTAYLIGKPLLGLRVKDAVSAGDFVAFYQKKRTAPRKVHLVGVGGAGVVALHAAALRPDLFASVTLRETPKSWSQTLKTVPAGRQLENAVHDALSHYDLGDLVQMAGPEKVRFESR